MWFFFNILKERVWIFDLSNLYCPVLTMESFYSEVLHGGGVGDSSNKKKHNMVTKHRDFLNLKMRPIYNLTVLKVKTPNESYWTKIKYVLY